MPLPAPHEFNLDFPHLMLRAKAVKFSKGQAKWRDRLITSTDAVFSVLGQPGIADAVNFANGQDSLRSLCKRSWVFTRKRPPKFHGKTFKRQHKGTLGANLPVTASGARKAGWRYLPPAMATTTNPSSVPTSPPSSYTTTFP